MEHVLCNLWWRALGAAALICAACVGAAQARGMRTANSVPAARVMSSVPAPTTGSWFYEPTPHPLVKDSELRPGVDCLSPTSCMAVGEVFGRKDHTRIAYPFALQRTGAQWSRIAMPTPTNAITTYLENPWGSPSCWSSSGCMAVGYYSTTFAGYSTLNLAEMWNGSSWSIVPTPSFSKRTQLYGVSCPSSTTCVATGTYTQPRTNTSLPFFALWNGSTWTGGHVSLPAGVAAGGLGDVSCNTTTNCWAVSSPYSSGEVVIADHWNGKSWAAHELPPPAGATQWGGLLSISCRSKAPSEAQCIAVGFANGPAVELWDGTSWSSISAPSFPGTGGSLWSVSCGSLQSCVAVYSNYAAVWNGSTWSVDTPPIPTGYSNPQLYKVSCVSAQACVAVGTVYNGQAFVPLAERYSAS